MQHNNQKRTPQLIDIGATMTVKIEGLASIGRKDYTLKRLCLAKGTLAILCAAGNCGKTMLAQHLACCVSSGLPFLGEFAVGFGDVLHIDQEQSWDQTKLRYERLANGQKLSATRITRYRFEERIDDPTIDRNYVKDMLVEMFRGKRLVIIDSLKAISAADENSAEIEVVCKLLKQAAEESGATVVLIHHKGKGNITSKQSGRGHSSIYDSVDVQIDLDSSDQVFELKCAKNRDGRFFDGITYQLLDEGDWFEDQNCTTALVFQLLSGSVKNRTQNLRDRILLAVKGHETIKHGDLYNLVKGDKPDFNNALTGLLKSGDLEESKGPKASRLFFLTTKGESAASYIQEAA